MQQQTETDIDSIPDERIRGADFGLEKFITLDNSASEEYLRFLRQSEEKIKRIQVHFSRKKKGSRRRRKLAMKLAQLHLHVKRQREDYQNKLVSTLLNKDMDVLVTEAFGEEYAAKPLPLKVDRRCCVWQLRKEVFVQGRDALKASLLCGPMGYYTILPQLSRMGSKGSFRSNS